MSRVGWKGGRFDVNYETSEIYKGLRDWQRLTGDEVNYFRFAYDQSNNDSVYGEASGPNGRVYFGPSLLPALHVNHIEGDNQDTEDGFYYNDSAHITISFDQWKRSGLNKLDLNTQNYLKDRFVYDTKVFRVTNIQIMGQIQQKDIIVGIDGTQVKPDEMVNDIQFAQYATPNDVRFSQYYRLNDLEYSNYDNGHGVFPLGYKGTDTNPLNMRKEVLQVVPIKKGPDLFNGYGFGGYGQGTYSGEDLGPVSFGTDGVDDGYGEGGYGEEGYGGLDLEHYIGFGQLGY